MTAPGTRLPAAERRRGLIDAARCVFATGSYRGATTAEIAREAGVSEPILYRHFGSKRELYLACLEQAWGELRAAWEQALEQSEPGEWLRAMGRVSAARRERKGFLAKLWIQAVSEAGEDAEIRRYLRRHIREVHAFVADVVRRAQAEGAIPEDRDASAEAWIFLAVGLLATFGERLGGLLSADDLASIAEARSRWVSGAL